MKIWYEVLSYSNEIKPVEVIGETAKQIVYLSKNLYTGTSRERRTMKSSSFNTFYPTWEAAKAALINRYQSQIEHAQRELARAQRQLQIVQALVEVKS